MSDVLEPVRRLFAAQNAGDLDAMVACFAEDYRSEQPCHPTRTFVGSAQVRTNWSRLLEGIARFHAELLNAAANNNDAWVEFRWTGARKDGTAFEERGVGIFHVIGGRIAAARLYAEEVDAAGPTIDDTVTRMIDGGRE